MIQDTLQIECTQGEDFGMPVMEDRAIGYGDQRLR